MEDAGSCQVSEFSVTVQGDDIRRAVLHQERTDRGVRICRLVNDYVNVGIFGLKISRDFFEICFGFTFELEKVQFGFLLRLGRPAARQCSTCAYSQSRNQCSSHSWLPRATCGTVSIWLGCVRR